MLRASVRRVPLAGQSQTVCAPEGASLAQLVADAFPDAFLRRFVVAFIDGVEVAQDAWDELKPRAGDIINLCVRPGRGDSGVGKVLRTVLQIAIVAAAAWVGGMIGGIPGMIASALITMGGNLILNSLIPLTPLTAKGEAPAPFYTVTGARNTAKVYAPASFVLGKHRFFPPLYGRYVQETVGNDVYLRVPFCLGPAPVQISDLKIGDTPITSFADVEIEERLTAIAPDHTLYTGDPDQEAVGAQLTTDYTARNTALDVDEIEVVLGFRGGLGGYDSKQRKVSKGVSFEIRYRPAGTSDAWQTHRPDVPQANAASAAAGVPFRPSYFLSLPNLIGYIGALNALGDVPSGPVVVTRADPGRGFQHVVRFAVPRHPDGYAVEVRRTTAESTDPNTVDAVWWEILGSVRSFVDPFPEKKLASIVLRIKASAQLSGVIDSFNCIVEPIVPLFSAGAKASPAGASAASLSTTGISRNPAELVLNLYRGSQAARPRPDDRIDWPAWAAFAAFCETNGLHYDEVIDVTIGRGELARRICASAFARPIRWGGKLSVVIDRDRDGEAPAQVFSPRNVSNLQWRKTFPLDVHAVRIAFNNAENGYQADEVTLYLDGYDASNATKFETLNVSGKTDPDEVRRVGRQFINNSLLQTESFSFDMDAEALTCRPGAYTTLLHDAIGVGLGAHRVKAIETSGGNVTAFTLDVAIPTEASDSLGARWRKEDGAGGFAVATERAITRDAANPARFVFTTPVAVAEAPAVEDVVLVGRTEEVSLPVLVRDVAPDFKHRASVTVIPYAGERFTPDGSPLPPHDPMVQLPIAARPATPIALTTTANAREIVLSFFQGPSPRGVTLTGFETAVREHGDAADSWQDRGPLPADARVFVAPAGNPGYSYDFRIVAVGNDSGGLPVRSDPLIVEDVAAAISPAAPAGCSAVFETRTSAGGASQLVLVATWTAVEDPDVLDTRVEMRTATGPDVYAEIGQGRAANGRTEIHGLQVGRSYTLGFVHLSRRGIASARTTIAPVAAPDVLVATAAYAAAPGSPLEGDFDAAVAAAVAAAASASAAATHATNAATAEANAEAAEAAAEAAQAAADAILDDTEAAQAAAEAAQAAATTAATNAATSASAAAGSATAAAGSATTASTAATNAGTSATAAAASVVSAQSVANRLLPDRPSIANDFVDIAASPAPDSATPISSGTVVAVANEGDVRQFTAAGGAITRGALPVGSGRTFKLDTRTRVTVDGTGNRFRSGFQIYNSSWSNLGFIANTEDASATVADGWQSYSCEITSATIIAAHPTAAYVRGRAVGGDNSGGANSGATWQLAEVRLRDITSEAAAAASASAAATSASSAATSATNAGTSASAASTSATNAATSAGAASTSATNASNSATTAAGHASTASTQATNAANSATAAAGSASAASTSASNASTSATNAGNSATSAASSAVSAQSVANRLLPARPGVAADFAGASTGSPEAATALAGTTVTDATEGSVREFVGGFAVYSRGLIPIVAGKMYRLRIRVRTTVDAGASPEFVSRAYWLDSAYAATGSPASGFSVVHDTNAVAADGWQTYTRDISTDAILAAQPAAVYLRARMTGGLNSASVNQGNTWRISLFELEDVTSEYAALASAAAAATSASTASTHATNAGTSASAAATSATNAATSAGNASTSATNASNSVTTASGHAGTASTQATNAATSYQNVLNTVRGAPQGPFDFRDGLIHYTDSRAGNPASMATTTAFTLVTDDSDFGNCGQSTLLTAAGHNLLTKAVVSATSGRIYRVTIRYKVTASDGSVNFNLIASGLDAAYAQTSIASVSPATVTGTGVVQEMTATFGVNTTNGAANSWPASSVWLRFGLRLNSAEAGLTVRVGQIRVEDVTEQMASAASASAAAASASTASTQATNAGNSATAAAASAVSARSASIAQGIGPSDFNDDGLYWTNVFGGTPAAATDPVATYANIAGVGRVAQFSTAAGSRYLTQKFAMQPIAGRKYKLTALVRVTANATGGGVLAASFQVNGLDTTYAHGVPTYTQTAVSGVQASKNPIAAADGWQKISLYITPGTPGTYDFLWRPRLDMVRTGGAGGTFEVAYFQIEDATESDAAAGSASAAATSASSAGTSATNAGTSATAASTSATNAATSASNASTSATTASTQATNASNSAAAAAASATLAATYSNAGESGLVNNSKFQAPLVGSVPTGWSSWVGTGSQVSRIGSTGYAFRQVGAAATSAGINQSLPHGSITQGPYLLRATIRRTSGPLTGASVLVQFLGPTDVLLDSATLDFSTEANVHGATTSTPDGVVSYEKVITAPANTSRAIIYALTHWGSGSFGSVASANQIDWHEVDLQFTGTAEKRLTTAEASISTNASAIATETSARAAETTTLRALMYGKNDGVIPDADMRDAAWWGCTTGASLVDADSSWLQRRHMIFSSGAYDFYSQYFPVEPGATYRIRVRIVTSGWSGSFVPLIHIPNHAWFSLKHGTAVDPSINNSANRIVAAGDTGNLEWTLTNPTGVSGNANRVWQFRMYGTFTGAAAVSVEIIRLDQYAQVQTNAAAIATVDGKLSASYALTVDANGRIASMKLLSNGVTSAVKFTASSFTIHDGLSDVPMFEVAGGSAYVAGSKVRTESMAANSVSTGVANEADAAQAFDQSWTAIASVSVTTPDAASLIYLPFSAYVESVGFDATIAQARIRRNSTVIYETDIAGEPPTLDFETPADGAVHFAPTFNGQVSGFDTDAPGAAGAYVYTLEFRTNGTGSHPSRYWQASRRRLFALLFKR